MALSCAVARGRVLARHMHVGVGAGRTHVAHGRGWHASRIGVRAVTSSAPDAHFPNDSGVSYFVAPGVSHVQGSDSPPLLQTTIGDTFFAKAEERGEAPALVVCTGAEEEQALSYTELAYRVRAVARGLLRLGLRKGDRVGVWMPNNAEWTVTQLATAAVGMVLVNINPAYRVPELQHALNLVEVSALVLVPRLATSNYVDMIQSLCPEIAAGSGAIQSTAVPSLKHVIVAESGGSVPAGMMAFEDLYVDSTSLQDEADAVAATLVPDEAINIQFTSGTTGRPKGATLTHRGILNNGLLSGRCQQLTQDDRICVAVPLYHCFGMTMGNLAAFVHGAAVVYPGRVFNPRHALECVVTQRCTALYGVPTMFIAELSDPGFHDFDLSTLRTGIMAGSLCPHQTMRAVMRDMHMSDVTIAYGMTETSPVSFQTRVADPVIKRCETVGRVMPHTECRLVDGEGNVVQVGTPGELQTRGYLVMQRYWGDEAQTAAAIDSEGWMRTGDLATFDEDGFLTIVGRIKDMIIRGGENIYPREVEDALFDLPGVVNAQVVGVPDAKYGEAVCAFLVVDQADHPATQEARAQEWVATQLRDKVMRHKIPAYVLVVDSFDGFLTATGKVMKFELQATAVRRLGLDAIGSEA